MNTSPTLLSCTLGIRQLKRRRKKNEKEETQIHRWKQIEHRVNRTMNKALNRACSLFFSSSFFLFLLHLLLPWWVSLTYPPASSRVTFHISLIHHNLLLEWGYLSVNWDQRKQSWDVNYFHCFIRFKATHHHNYRRGRDASWNNCHFSAWLRNSQLLTINSDGWENHDECLRSFDASFGTMKIHKWVERKMYKRCVDSEEQHRRRACQVNGLDWGWFDGWLRDQERSCKVVSLTDGQVWMSTTVKI